MLNKSRPKNTENDLKSKKIVEKHQLTIRIKLLNNPLQNYFYPYKPLKLENLIHYPSNTLIYH